MDSFATVLKSAQALGKTSNLATKATDVTGQYVDLQARITALQASLQQYLTILAKATTIGDILAVQEQIDAIQSQIEQLQGQLQLLTSQTSYSTLTVTVNEGTPAPPPSPLPESGLVRAWHASVGGFVSGVEGVIRVARPLLFALLLLGVLLAAGTPCGSTISATTCRADQRRWRRPGGCRASRPRPSRRMGRRPRSRPSDPGMHDGIEPDGRQRGSGHDLDAAHGHGARGDHAVAGRRRSEHAVAPGPAEVLSRARDAGRHR